MAELIGLIVLVVTGIGGLILGIYNAIVGAKKTTVDALRELYEIEREKRIESEGKLAIMSEKFAKLEEELVERDELIADLRDWIERLLQQFAIHVPNVLPEEFIRRNSLRKK